MAGFQVNQAHLGSRSSRLQLLLPFNSHRGPWVPGKFQAILNAAWVFLLVAALAAGAFGRFSDLGSRPLAVDEYYFIASVHLILEKGVPELDLGGYYARSLPTQYLTGASILLFGDNAFAYRLPIALLSLLCLFLTYYYCRCHLGRVESLAVTAALMVSAWEIEFARFARMYIPLQCVTLGCLIMFHRSMKGERRLQGLFYLLNGLTLLAIIVHRIAIVFLPLLLLPLLQQYLKQGKRATRKLLKASILVVLVSCSGVAYAFAEGRLYLLGVSDPLPQSFVKIPETIFIQPVLPFLQVDPNMLVLWILVPSLLALVSLVLFTDANGSLLPAGTARIALLGLLLLAAAIHQFAMVALIVLALMKLKAFRWSFLRGRLAMALVSASGLGIVIWLFLAALNPEQVLEISPGDWPKAVKLAFLGWPDFYTHFIEPWFSVMPLLTLLLGTSLFWQALGSRDQPLERLWSNPALPLISFVLFISVFRAGYDTTRYSFFLYPAVLCLIMITLRGVSRKYFHVRNGLVPSFGFLLLFALSQDMQPRQALGVATEAVSYRLGAFERFKDHWYPRDDLQSPAAYLNSRTDPLQSLIVSEAERAMPFYLNRPFALYFSKEGPVYSIVARERGTRENWSGAPLLSSHTELRDYIEDSRIVWFTQRVDPRKRLFRIGEFLGRDLESEEVVYTSQDKRIEVVKVILREADKQRN